MRLLWQNYVNENSSLSISIPNSNYPVENVYDMRLTRIVKAEYSTISTATWSSVGNGLAISSAGVPALCAMTSSLVGYIDNINCQLQAYEFNGSTWALVGSGLAISSVTLTLPALCAMTSSLVGYIDGNNDELRAYEFNGSTWALVGSGLAISSVTLPVLCAMTSSLIGYIDATNDELRAYEFNGSTWALVGSGLAISSVGHPALCAMTSSLVGFIDYNNDELRAYEFNGSTWALVGSGLAISSVQYPALCAITSSLVGFIDSNNKELRAYEFNSSTWISVGSGLIISSVSFSALCAMTSSLVGFIDSGNDELRAYEFNSGMINYINIDIISTDSITPQYLAIVNHNISSAYSIYLEGGTSSGFSTLTFDETITWSSYIIISTIASTISCNYFRLKLIANSTSPDDLYIGYLFLGNYLELPGMKPDQTIKDETMARITISDGGQAYGDDNYSYRAPMINFPYITSTQRSEIREMFAYTKNIKPVIAIIWPENQTEETPIYSIIDQKNLEWKKTGDIGLPWSLLLQLREIF